MTEETLNRFGDVTAVVVGDVMLDSWLRGHSDRMAQEAPVPVVAVEEIEDQPGGAANAAVNLAALGARVHLVGVTGADPAGATLNATLGRLDIEGLVIVRSRRTSVKRRVLTDGRIVARYDEEDGSPLSEAAERGMIDQLVTLAAGADVIIACDYGGGVCTPAVRQVVCELTQGGRGPILVVDAHDAGRWRDCHAKAVLPNYAEVARLLGENGHADRVGFLSAQSERLLDATGAESVVTTLDDEGTLLHRWGREPYRTHATPAPDTMSIGAGDTFTATFALCLAVGTDEETAADVAQAAASVVVNRPGTAVCTREDLLGVLRPDIALSPDQLAGRIARDRAEGRRVVFTNGCFDVLHRGHVACLEEAARLGDVLVVAVNSDDGVARLKGSGRPINTCEDRVAVLAALGCVDYIAVFDEDSPEELLRLVRPDLYVKGGDYHPAMVPEADLVRELGGEVRVLGYVPDLSTTAIVNRIRG
ncbi:D-glycero-beta-D-manno-heptose 1-phosphate adenylyltransferase [Planotetraspora sp. A-T 1434]|uniref:D-glycero-beta-D-manno-heptose 1-phosphate adenylyltransferase n=1 Tax=Planotetraspora sp. A-T 1434 TaxID=2979219 RepID=UPI0021BF09BF|nr:D-glycero-beta-D-manno-heptose 1-phosphate adenylyltransferase [Planotetraspora sp. A-T 1434]MCT9933470.1 D-glycero-beta-D-manno-heptose 1-phosphate adenylyltransferase [Planotetraspora sp. A-T 1434]